MKLRHVRFLMLACVAALAVACSDGDDDSGGYIPPYITDMMEVSTDADGMLTRVKLDNGLIYDVSAQKRMSDAPDTVLRCRGAYTLDKGKFTLHGAAAVFADKPVPASAFTVVKNGVAYHGSEYLPRDPVKMVSMWQSGGYINLHLGVMTTGQGIHQYAFSKDDEGQYSLVHLRPFGDDESYTDQVYMSMPIPEDLDELTFSVYTYEGIYTRTFRVVEND